MIRREAFGGIIFDEPTHQVHTLDKISYRLVELFFIQALPFDTIRGYLRNEFGENRSTDEMEEFIAELKERFVPSVFFQRGRTDNEIWRQPWVGSHFSAPISNFWTFTNLCNLRCTHCAWNSATPLPGELDTGQCKQVIDQLYELGVAELSFSGGEPLAKKQQLLEMASYATSRQFHLGLATNATLVDNTTADELAHAGFDEVQVSVEGLEAHESIRGRGVWKRTVDGIRVLRVKGFDVTFAVAINKTNFGELDNIFTTAKREGVKNVRFVRFIPIGRGKRNMEAFEFSVEDEAKLASILWRKRWELFPETVVTFNKHYVSIGAIQNPGLGAIPETFGWNWDCPSGRSRICIMPQGKVAPCPLVGSLGLDGGDLTQNSLEEIWENSEFFRFIRSDKRRHSHECGACVLWDKCAGGCKASSFAHSGNLMAPDPLCLVRL